MKRFMVGAVLLVGALACTPQQEETPRTELIERDYFEPGQVFGARCDGDGALPRRPATVDVDLYRGVGVSDDELSDVGARGAALLAEHEVRLKVNASVRELDMTELLTATTQDLDAALRRAELTAAEGDDPRVRTVVRDAVMQPVRSLLQRLETASASDVRVIVLRRIASRRSVARQSLPHLTGVTFSPHLPADEGTDTLGTDSITTPTVFLSVEDLFRAGPVVRATTLAHELGHAAGLSHSDRTDDLMQAGLPRCVPQLSETQLEVLAARLAGR